MAYFPLFIDLEDKKVLAAGGGRIAARRIRVLLEFGACITVAAPELSEELKCLISETGSSRLVHLPREYRSGDLAGADLALAATDQREVNRQVYLDASAAGIPVNVCDRKEECSFYFPGIARKGKLVAGITAGGTDHRLARRITEAVRRLLEQEGQELGEKGMEDREQRKPACGSADQAGDGSAEESISGGGAYAHYYENDWR